MTSLERFLEEIPQPDTIVALIDELTREPWPKSAVERDSLFKRVGLRKVHQFTGNSADNFAEHVRLEIEAEGAPVFATSTEKDGLLTAVHLQLRVAMAPPAPRQASASTKSCAA